MECEFFEILVCFMENNRNCIENNSLYFWVYKLV
jgi:hypothetical protein